MLDQVVRVASFSNGDEGGNPAGVLISSQHPSRDDMQAIAAEVGYSETAFAEPAGDQWRVRYFSPESEVPFCGHATIALGAVLAKLHGAKVYPLVLNEATITVEGFKHDGQFSAALQSPPTHSTAADPQQVSEALRLFGYSNEDLSTDLPAAFINGGANHLLLPLKSRGALASMQYDLQEGKQFMNSAGLVTVMLVYAESPTFFHSRNPFASGGVYEDPATGAASAAFAGYLRDIDWPHQGCINLVQGQDMGSKSLIQVSMSDMKGESVRVSGAVRFM